MNPPRSISSHFWRQARISAGGKGVEVAPAGPVGRTTCDFGGGGVDGHGGPNVTDDQPSELPGLTEPVLSEASGNQALPAANISDLSAIRADLAPYQERYGTPQKAYEAMKVRMPWEK